MDLLGDGFVVFLIVVEDRVNCVDLTGDCSVVVLFEVVLFGGVFYMILIGLRDVLLSFFYLIMLASLTMLNMTLSLSLYYPISICIILLIVYNLIIYSWNLNCFYSKMWISAINCYWYYIVFFYSFDFY